MPSKILNLMNRKGLDTTIDFYVEQNNGVRAAYVVSPRILEKDNSDLFGVPFIFYVGIGETIHTIPQVKYTDGLLRRLKGISSEVEQLKKQGVPYLSEKQYWELVEGMRVGSTVPQTIQVRDRLIPIERLATKGYVPYSFGVNHDDDVLRKVRVRTQEEYDKMLNKILPVVRR